MEAIGALSGILTVISSVTKLAKGLNEVKDKYNNVALNTTLVASQLNIIRAALKALYDWRINDSDQSAPAQQLDSDLGVSLSCCAILINVIDGKLGESGYVPGVKEKIRYLWLEDTLKEYISNLESQVRALQLLLTIFQCSSSAERRQRLERADSRKIIEDVRAETRTLGVESQDLGDAASILSEHPSVTFDFDSIIMQSTAYQRIHRNKIARKPLPATPSQPPIPALPEKVKPPIPPRPPPRRGAKSQTPIVPPRPPPRPKTGAVTTIEVPKAKEFGGKDVAQTSVEEQNDIKEANATTEATVLQEQPVAQQQESQPDLKEQPSIQEAAVPVQDSHTSEAPPDLVLSKPTNDHETRPERAVPESQTGETLTKISSLTAVEPEAEVMQGANEVLKEQIPLSEDSVEAQMRIRCICDNTLDDGKIIRCDDCDTWQHAECYYIDDLGMVPTKQDLQTIHHLCAECAPRPLHVQEAVERKKGSQLPVIGDAIPNPEGITPSQNEPSLKEGAEKMSRPTSPNPEAREKPLSSAVEDLTTELDYAFGKEERLEPTWQPPPDAPRDSQKSINDMTPNDTGREDQQNPASSSSQPSEAAESRRKDTESHVEDTVAINAVLKETGEPLQEGSTIAPEVEDDKESVEPSFDSLYDVSIKAPSVKSTHDTQETAIHDPQDSVRDKPDFALTVTESPMSEEPSMSIDRAVIPATYPSMTDASSNSRQSIDSSSKTLAASLPLPTASAPDHNEESHSLNYVEILPKEQHQSYSPAGAGLGLTIPPQQTSPDLVDNDPGTPNMEPTSPSTAASPPLRRPPPLPPMPQPMRDSGTVESVMSTESSDRGSSTFDAASTVSSDVPDANTIFSVNSSIPTAATTLGTIDTTGARTRAQSDLRRLQAELSEAKAKGDSRAREESIQKSIQVIRDHYLNPSAEESGSPKKSPSPRLSNRTSFLRLPSLYGSLKTAGALCEAAGCNDETALRRILEEKANKANVNARIAQDTTAFMQAAFFGHVESMQILKDYGADECLNDTKGRTALHIAVAANQVRAVQWLLKTYPSSPRSPPDRSSKLFHSRSPKNLREIGDNDGSTALHIATERELDTMLNTLLSLGLDSEAKDNLGHTALHRAVISQKRISFDILLRSNANPNAADTSHKTPLHFAASAGSTDLIKALLSRNAHRYPPTKEGILPLHSACRNVHIPALATLLTTPSDLNAPTKSGERPLHIAAAIDSLPLTEYLLTTGGPALDINPFATPGPTTLRNGTARSLPLGTQLTPLHYACALNALEIVLLLLSHGAWVNAPTDKGATALMIAADIESTNLVNILLSSGAKVNASTPTTCVTALHIAARRGDLETVQQLCRAGADESKYTGGNNQRQPAQEAMRCSDKVKKQQVLDYLGTVTRNKFKAQAQARASNGTVRGLGGGGGPSLDLNRTATNASTTTTHSAPPPQPLGGYMPWGGGVASPPHPHAVPMGYPHGWVPVGGGAGAGYAEYLPQQQALLDSLAYEARFDSPPAYEPGNAAPRGLAGREGVWRPGG